MHQLSGQRIRDGDRGGSMRVDQTRLKYARSARRLGRAPQYAKKAARITKQARIDRTHLTQSDKSGGVVVRQEAQELA